MQYLVLKRFRTYGKELVKGQVVDEAEIRSPLLRMSEGKIVPAVSSSTVPAEPGVDVEVSTTPRDTEMDDDKTGDTKPEDIKPEGSPDEPVNTAEEAGSEPTDNVSEGKAPKKLFSFKG